MSRIRVALFDDAKEAERACRRLVKVGIPARVDEEPGVAKLWFVPRKHRELRLDVPARCVEHSRQVLLGKEEAAPLPGAIRCPNCGSLRVDFPQFTEKSLLTNVVMGLAAGLKLVDKEYYCEDCHHLWPRPGMRRRRRPRHPAPDYFLEDT